MKRSFLISFFLPFLFSGLTVTSSAQWNNYSIFPLLDVIKGIDFADTATGIAVGFSGSPNPTGKILRSTNGGLSFSVVQTYPDSYFEDVFFFNADTGYVCGAINGRGLICRTFDAGLTWDSVSLGSVFELMSVFFVSSTTGYALGGATSESILKTLDGGLTWSVVSVLPSNARPESVFFTNLLTGYVVTGGETSSNGRIWTTGDGGLSWTDISPPGNRGYTSIYFVDENCGFATSNSGTIYKTLNHGLLWAGCIDNDPSTSAYTDIDFANNVIGFACGYDGSVSKVLKTTNSGFSWSVDHNASSIVVYYGVCCMNERRSIAGGTTYYSLTTNAGGGITNYATAHISGYDSLCSSNQATIKFEFTGVPPWSVTYYHNFNYYPLSNINSTPYYHSVTPSVPNPSYIISAFSDGNGNSANYGGLASYYTSTTPGATLSKLDTSCSTNQCLLKFNLSGCTPISFTYTDGTNNYTINNVYGSPYYISVAPSVPTLYSLISVTDINGTSSVNDTTMVYPAYPVPVILGDTVCVTQVYSPMAYYKYRLSDTSGDILYVGAVFGNITSYATDSVQVEWLVPDTIGILKIIVKFPGGCTTDTIYKYVRLYEERTDVYPFCNAIPVHMKLDLLEEGHRRSYCPNYGTQKRGTVDREGNYYVTCTGDSSIRKNDVFFASTLSDPFGIAFDQEGYLWVICLKGIEIFDSTGTRIFQSLQGTGYVDGSLNSALFFAARDIAFDSKGNAFIADYGNACIRKIDTSGNVTTFAGTNSYGYVDGGPTQARFNSPYGLSIDSRDNIYVADRFNDRIRKIDTLGNVSTYSGNGSNNQSIDGPPGLAQYTEPIGVAVDFFDRVYVSDRSPNALFRFIHPNGYVSTVTNDCGFSTQEVPIYIDKATNNTYLFGVWLSTDKWKYCYGDTLTIISGRFSSRPVSYSWSNGATDSSFTVFPVSDTIFTLYAVDSTRMPVARHVDIMRIAPQITTNGITLTSSPGQSYQWYLNGVPISGATSQSYSTGGAGYYQVLVTDNLSGCSALSDSLYFLPPTLVHESVSSPGIVISPNPFSHSTILTVEHGSASDARLELYDLYGRKLREIIMNGNIMELRRGNLSAGIYIVKIVGKGQIWSGKLIIE